MIELVAAWLVSATIKGSLIAAIALLAGSTMRNRIPSRWLCALLLVAMIRLLLPVAPSAPFSAFNLLRDATIAPLPHRIIEGPPVPRTTRFAAAPATALIEAPRWTLPLFALWLAGVLAFAVRVCVRTFTFRRRLRHARAITDPEVVRLVDEGRDALRVHRGVRVLESAAVSTPALHGWLQPALLLPDGFLSTFSAEQLRYVVLHELAHVRRSDVLVNWIVTAAHALHWFNPLVHLAAARLAEERELACDALALAALRDHERAAYGTTVLELLDRLRPDALAPAVVGMTTTKRQLHRRIQMIATFRKSRHSLAFGLAVLAISIVTLTDATAGERRMLPRIQVEPLSPGTQATIEKLEKAISAEVQSGAVEDIALTLSNATGVAIQFEDGALTDEVRAARVSIKAKDVPAHLILVETLASVNLAVRFNDNGVSVEPIPAGERMLPRTLPPSAEARQGHRRVMVMPRDKLAVAGSGTIRVMTPDASGDGRTFHVKGENENGAFELEVKREQ
jgi:beta-lactamase regulating signal transducer with metallopeptidase domain